MTNVKESSEGNELYPNGECGSFSNSRARQAEIIHVWWWPRPTGSPMHHRRLQVRHSDVNCRR
jgi:hypothetical protein